MTLLWAAYASATKWDYSSRAKEQDLKNRLKQKGLSIRYYFIPARRMLLLNALSGGIFFFYWSFQQWRAVCSGYKNAAGVPLKYSPFLRTLFIFISFYQLTAVINHTCLYMRKKPAMGPFVWGTLLWGGLAAACTPFLGVYWRTAGGVLFLLAPYALQRRINSLAKELPPSRLKMPEIAAVLAGWTAWGALAAVKFF